MFFVTVRHWQQKNLGTWPNISLFKRAVYRMLKQTAARTIGNGAGVRVTALPAFTYSALIKFNPI
jgi:hypothetical protein